MTSWAAGAADFNFHDILPVYDFLFIPKGMLKK
jgi:hypothetical protein